MNWMSNNKPIRESRLIAFRICCSMVFTEARNGVATSTIHLVRSIEPTMRINRRSGTLYTIRLGGPQFHSDSRTPATSLASRPLTTPSAHSHAIKSHPAGRTKRPKLGSCYLILDALCFCSPGHH